MGTYLEWLPASLTLPVIFSVFIVALILQRRFHERAERRRSEEELLRFSNLQLLTSTLSEVEDPKQMVDRTLDGTLQALGLSDGCMMIRVEGPEVSKAWLKTTKDTVFLPGSGLRERMLMYQLDRSSLSSHGRSIRPIR